jgi:hypothetical protein
MITLHIVKEKSLHFVQKTISISVFAKVFFTLVAKKAQQVILKYFPYFFRRKA